MLTPMKRFLLFCAFACPATQATAALPLMPQRVWSMAPAKMPSPKRATKAEANPGDWVGFETVLPAERPMGDVPQFAATEATRNAVAISLPSMKPVLLRIQPLAGHRAFDSMRLRASILGWAVEVGNNILGVGVTGAYGVKIASNWRIAPFVSLDYNRIDSARYVDSTGPRPYVTNNADSGLNASAGALVSHRFRAVKKLRVIGYFAAIVGSDQARTPTEAASAGARVIQSLGSSGPQSTWWEYGAGADYALSPSARIGAAVVENVDRAEGAASFAAKLSARFAF